MTERPMTKLFLDAEGKPGEIKLVGGRTEYDGPMKNEILKRSDVSRSRATPHLLAMLSLFKLLSTGTAFKFKGQVAEKIASAVETAERNGGGWLYKLFGQYNVAPKDRVGKRDGPTHDCGLRWIARVDNLSNPEITILSNLKPEDISISWNGHDLTSPSQLREFIIGLGYEEALQSYLHTGTKLDVQVWSDQRNLWPKSIFEEGVLPIRVKEQFQARVTLETPAFVQLVWIGASGNVYFPESTQDSDGGAISDGIDRSGPLTKSFPSDSGFSTQESPTGLETLVVLVSHRPLIRSEVEDRLDTLPSPPAFRDLPMPVQFDWPDLGASKTDDGERDLLQKTQKEISLYRDPAPNAGPLRSNRIRDFHDKLKDVLKDLCDQIRIVSFSSYGEDEHQSDERRLSQKGKGTTTKKTSGHRRSSDA